MIIIIPINGKGLRFKNIYKEPKALINVEEKCILFWLLDNLKIIENIDYIYIPYNKEEYQCYDFENKIISRYKDYKFKFYPIEYDTYGALHTINIALKYLIDNNEDDKPILSLDCDNFYTNDIIKEWNGTNSVFTFEDYIKDKIAKFSYVSINNYNEINSIKEKKYIEGYNLACCGAYGFKSLYDLYTYSSTIIERHIQYIEYKELYISDVIAYMIKLNIKINNKLIKNKDYFSLGTPEQIKEFEYVYLFDLDGTLIDTDNLYIKIWNELLKKYNINIDKIFFDKYIKGLSDEDFLKSLFPNIIDEEIKLISEEKDDLFIKNINYIDIYNKSLDFIKKKQNSRIAIITNCNKKVAINILNKFNIDNYINILITADDCINKKPDKEPYIKAIEKLDCNIAYKNNNCIVFEDSISGYNSAKNADIKRIFIKINDNYEYLYKMKGNYYEKYEDLIDKNLLEYDNNIDIIIKVFNKKQIKKILYNNSLKDEFGYISSVYSYSITEIDNNIYDIIIKKPNNNNNVLNNVAKKIDLYNNELIFYKYYYEKVKDYLNIPKYYNYYKNDDNISLILENLNNYTGSFNINLNNNIDILLKVIKNIAKLHINNIYNNEEEIPKDIKKIKDFKYYNILIKERYLKFLELNNKLLSNDVYKIMNNIYVNYENKLEELSLYPLNLCHGDVKSPNIYYKYNKEPYFIDWQYINLNKGISDIVFLLCESINFDINIYEIVINYYYLQIKDKNIYKDYSEYLKYVKLSFESFPFFVCIWFNTEDSNELIDKSFPLRFMKNYIKYLEYINKKMI
jgi:beta-phosphoglucomutase-like phosphatase (HAD superfamily)